MVAPATLTADVGAVRIGAIMSSILDEFDHSSLRRNNNPRNAGKRKTACKHGHPYTEANTIWRLVKGRRTRACRECDRQRKRDARRR